MMEPTGEANPVASQAWHRGTHRALEDEDQPRRASALGVGWWITLDFLREFHEVLGGDWMP